MQLETLTVMFAGARFALVMPATLTFNTVLFCVKMLTKEIAVHDALTLIFPVGIVMFTCAHSGRTKSAALTPK